MVKRMTIVDWRRRSAVGRPAELFARRQSAHVARCMPTRPRRATSAFRGCALSEEGGHERQAFGCNVQIREMCCKGLSRNSCATSRERPCLTSPILKTTCTSSWPTRGGPAQTAFGAIGPARWNCFRPCVRSALASSAASTSASSPSITGITITTTTHMMAATGSSCVCTVTIRSIHDVTPLTLQRVHPATSGHRRLPTSHLPAWNSW